MVEHSGSSLAELGAAVLSTADPLKKSMLSHLGYCRWREKGLPIGVFEPPAKPARPPIPKLVCKYLLRLWDILIFFTRSLLSSMCALKWCSKFIPLQLVILFRAVILFVILIIDI